MSRDHLAQNPTCLLGQSSSEANTSRESNGCSSSLANRLWIVTLFSLVWANFSIATREYIITDG